MKSALALGWFGFAVFAALAGCGDSTEADDDVGGSSSSSSSSGSVDAGVTLPSDLRDCSATPPTSPRATDSIVALNKSLPSPLGRVVREGSFVPDLRLPFEGEGQFEETNELSVLESNAAPLTATGFETLTRLAALAGGDQDIAKYLEANAGNPDEELLYRFYLEQNAYVLLGGSNASSEGTQEGDEFVFRVTGHSVWSFDAAMRFPDHAACHVANLKRLVLGSFDDVGTYFDFVAAAGDAQLAPLVQAYFDRMLSNGDNLPQLRISVFSTNGNEGLELRGDGCSATSFAGCAAIAERAAQGAQAFQDRRVTPTRAHLAGEEPMPLGWSAGNFAVDFVQTE